MLCITLISSYLELKGKSPTERVVAVFGIRAGLSGICLLLCQVVRLFIFTFFSLKFEFWEPFFSWKENYVLAKECRTFLLVMNILTILKALQHLKPTSLNFLNMHKIEFRILSSVFSDCFHYAKVAYSN